MDHDERLPSNQSQTDSGGSDMLFQRAWRYIQENLLGPFVIRTIFAVLLGAGAFWTVLSMTLDGYKLALDSIGREIGGIGIEVRGVKTEVSELKTTISRGDMPAVNAKFDILKAGIRAQIATIRSEDSPISKIEFENLMQEVKRSNTKVIEEIHAIRPPSENP